MTYGPSFPAAPSEPPPSPTGRALHPLSLGQVVDLSLRMLRFRWRAIYVAAGVLLVPAYTVLALAQPAVAAPFVEWAAAFEELLLDVAPGELPPALPPPPAGLAEAVVLSIVLGLLTGLLTFVATGAVVHVAGETYEGREASPGRSVRETLRRLPSLFGAWLVTMLVTLVVATAGFVTGGVLIVAGGAGPAAFAGLIIIVAAVVAVAFISVRWGLVTQTVMVEGAGTLAALGRSWRVVAGSTWRVLAYLLLIAIVVGLLSTVLSTAASLLVGGGDTVIEPTLLVAEGLLNGLVAILLLPIGALVLTLLYYDLRWRRGEFQPATGTRVPSSGLADGPAAGDDQRPGGWR